MHSHERKMADGPDGIRWSSHTTITERAAQNDGRAKNRARRSGRRHRGRILGSRGPNHRATTMEVSRWQLERVDRRHADLPTEWNCTQHGGRADVARPALGQGSDNSPSNWYSLTNLEAEAPITAARSKAGGSRKLTCNRTGWAGSMWSTTSTTRSDGIPSERSKRRPATWLVRIPIPRACKGTSLCTGTGLRPLSQGMGLGGLGMASHLSCGRRNGGGAFGGYSPMQRPEGLPEAVPRILGLAAGKLAYRGLTATA